MARRRATPLLNHGDCCRHQPDMLTLSTRLHLYCCSAAHVHRGSSCCFVGLGEGGQGRVFALHHTRFACASCPHYSSSGCEMSGVVVR